MLTKTRNIQQGLVILHVSLVKWDSRDGVSTAMRTMMAVRYGLRLTVHIVFQVNVVVREAIGIIPPQILQM